VRHTSGEPPDRFHALGLAKLLLQVFTLADVDEHTLSLFRPALLVA